jgi:hypothetical protein
VAAGAVSSPEAIAQPDRMETWPAWSADGQHLYFCSCGKLPVERCKEIRYDLMRVPYDIDSDTWGDVETIVSARDTGMSVAQPRPSPDGRFLLFCMAKCGSFPVYQKSSDLYLMDLKTRAYRRLDVNSDEADSWHCWSSNGRWIVFSSKRHDGLFARPHISYFDPDGKAHKAFVLPQKDPTFYNRCIYTYNVPELIREPITIREKDFAKAVVKPDRRVAPKSGDHSEPEYHPSGQTQPPWRRARP